MRKGTFLAGRVLAAALLLCWSAALSYAYKLPDTGQTKCYNESGTEISCTGTGQELHNRKNSDNLLVIYR